MGISQLIRLIPGVTLYAMTSDALLACATTTALGCLLKELFRRVRGLALAGEATHAHILQAMDLQEQRDFFQSYLKKACVIFGELGDRDTQEFPELVRALEKNPLV